MSAGLQAKLLHVLQDGTFSRLGGRANVQVDARVLAATNIDVKKAMAERRLREDLYYRLNAFTLTVPPLRERREEIPVLLRYYMNNLARQFGKNTLQISSKLEQECLQYHWPGNLRELGNLVKRYLVLEDENQLVDELRSKARDAGAEDGATSSTGRGGLKALVRSLKDDAEAREIQRALDDANWNRKVAAAELNISYKALLYKIKQHGLSPSASREVGLRAKVN
jgi:transcriptional regulator with PAS, ATPase and Fis domain